MKELNIVPLSALRAVEAVARLGGLRAAAEEMGVSEGAVSQAVLKAEGRLGRPLFDRRPKGMRPTELGSIVCAGLTRGLGEIAGAVRLARRETADLLTVSVAPVFAGRWLVPRLGRFHDAHPRVRLRVDARTDLVDPNATDIDVCVRAGRGGWDDVVSRKLSNEPVFPVCSPELAKRLNTPADISGLPILRDKGDADGWTIWLAAQGLSADVLGGGSTFSDAGLCIDAAIAGQGVYLAWATLARDVLAAGSLVRPFAEAVDTGRGYWLVTPQIGRTGGTVQAFGDWLDQELATP